ncbi:Serine/threonine-protein kinase, partial [Spiromyces aspiralis]
EKGTDVAVKSVARAKLTSKLLTNLEAEINILKGVTQGNVVRLIDCLRSRNHVYLVMEYCSLGDLASYIRRRWKYPDLRNPYDGLDVSIIRHILAQVASAVSFLKSRNIIHRDIKPQNLLLRPPSDDYQMGVSESRGQFPLVKVADFGFARFLKETSLTNTLCGSPLYMAPEILRYEYYDAKVDLWSVGAVAYEMLTGRPPFRADNHVELLKKIEMAEDNIQFPDESLPIITDRASNSSQLSLSDVLPSVIDPTPMTHRDALSSAGPSAGPGSGLTDLNMNVINKLPASAGSHPELDPEIKDFIRRLLKRHPKERMDFADFFVHPALKQAPPSHSIGADAIEDELSAASDSTDAIEAVRDGAAIPDPTTITPRLHPPNATAVTENSTGRVRPGDEPHIVAEFSNMSIADSIREATSESILGGARLAPANDARASRNDTRRSFSIRQNIRRLVFGEDAAEPARPQTLPEQPYQAAYPPTSPSSLRGPGFITAYHARRFSTSSGASNSRTSLEYIASPPPYEHDISVDQHSESVYAQNHYSPSPMASSRATSSSSTAAAAAATSSRRKGIPIAGTNKGGNAKNTPPPSGHTRLPSNYADRLNNDLRNMHAGGGGSGSGSTNYASNAYRRLSYADPSLTIERDFVVIDKRAIEFNELADELDSSPKIPSIYPTNTMVGLGMLEGNVGTYSGRAGSGGSGITASRSRGMAEGQREAGVYQMSAPARTTFMHAADGYPPNTSPQFRTRANSSATPSNQSTLESELVDTFSSRTTVPAEENVIRRLEALARQALAITYLADIKLAAIPSIRRTMRIATPVPGEIRPEDNLSIEESFALYLKAMTLFELALESVREYWGKVNPRSLFAESDARRYSTSAETVYPIHSRLGGGLVTGLTRGAATTSPALNQATQWVRKRYNECFDKADTVKDLASNGSFNLDNVSVEQIIYNKALELSRAAARRQHEIESAIHASAQPSSSGAGAVKPSVTADLAHCERAYQLCIWMLGAILTIGPDELDIDEKDRGVVNKFISSIARRLYQVRRMMQNNSQHVLSPPMTAATAMYPDRLIGNI